MLILSRDINEMTHQKKNPPQRSSGSNTSGNSQTKESRIPKSTSRFPISDNLAGSQHKPRQHSTSITPQRSHPAPFKPNQTATSTALNLTPRSATSQTLNTKHQKNTAPEPTRPKTTHLYLLHNRHRQP